MKKKIILLFLIYFTLLSEPCYAYIDPGVGSMLFSVVLCSITTVFFLFNTLILKFKRILFSEKTLSKNKHKFVIYSEGKQYYCVFKPILDEFETRKIPVMFYTSSPDDPIFKDEYEFVKKEFIGKGNKAYFKLAFLKADICLMTTPHLDVMQLKRSKDVKHYSHIFHSIGFSMGYRLFGIDYYDSILCDSDFQIPLIRELEEKRNLKAKELVVTGSTYMDFYKNKLEKIQMKKSQKTTIVVAPSWGDIGLLKKYGEKLISNLLNGNFNIIIRPHPQSMVIEKGLIESLMKKFPESEHLIWDFSFENITTLSKADILISDFSCIMSDYAFLFNKPFIYIKTDLKKETRDFGDLNEIPWYYKMLNEIGYELKIEKGDLDNIEKIIDSLKNNDSLYENIRQASDYAWKNKGEAAKNAVNFLVQKQKELDKC